MQRMRRQLSPLLARPAAGQKGMTTLGLIIMTIFLGLFAFAFIRLTPVYLNYMKIAGVIDGVVQEFEGQNASRAAVRQSISRRPVRLRHPSGEPPSHRERRDAGRFALE